MKPAVETSVCPVVFRTTFAFRFSDYEAYPLRTLIIQRTQRISVSLRDIFVYRIYGCAFAIVTTSDGDFHVTKILTGYRGCHHT